MKRKSIALLLALAMCLSLLSACGGDSAQNTEEPTTSSSAPGTTEQQPADEKEEQPSQEPEQTEPEESEEPTQEPEENAGTKFLALLQEEWQNGFYAGEGPRHTYFRLGYDKAAINNEVVYIPTGWATGSDVSTCISYNIATKELSELEFIIGSHTRLPDLFMDGCFWRISENKIVKTDSNGAELKSIELAVENSKLLDRVWFEKGFLYNFADKSLFVPYDLEKTVEIPVPQREVEHGLKENIDLSQCKIIFADGTAYLQPYNLTFRLNTDTCEWETVELPVTDDFNRNNSTTPFCGKYVIYNNGIYDWLTGERVFDWNEAGVYPPVCADQYKDDYLCYFGGEQYLGYSGGEFRWVNLKDLSMSDPLTFPNIPISDYMIVLNDTYCVYHDDYGLFLWNYNTGEEETLRMFGN